MLDIKTNDQEKVCPPGHKHGGTSTCYGTHKCRCGACRAANAKRQEGLRERRRQWRQELEEKHHVEVDDLPPLGVNKGVCAICEEEPVQFGIRDCEACVEETMKIWREDQSNARG